MDDQVLRFEPIDPNLNGYLEDTIVIDWQTPIVSERARSLTQGLDAPEDRLRALFTFVRDEIALSFDIETDAVPCNASEVLRAGHGLCYAKSHLLAAFVRYCGWPAGFAFQRLRRVSEPDRFVLHGFVAVRWPEDGRWIALDANGGSDGSPTHFDLETPSLAFTADPEKGEETMPFVHSKPPKHIVGLLSRSGSLARAKRTLPDSV